MRKSIKTNMTEQPIPNHEAMNTVSPVIEAFASEHDLTGEVRLGAADRVGEAQEVLRKIDTAVGEEGVDKAVAEYVDDAIVSDTVNQEEERVAVAVGVQEVYEHPDSSLLTAGELGIVPVEDLGEAMRDLGEVSGPAAVEAVIEAVEVIEDNRAATDEELSSTDVLKSNDAMWNKISELTSTMNPYANKDARVRRLPISLPMRTQSEYDAGSVHYASGGEMKDTLELYGVDPAVIKHAAENDWNVEASALPPELQHSLLTANIYEATTRSRDPEIKQQASERNSHVTVEDIWQPSTLHHVTKVKNLATILQNGQLGVALNEDGSDVVNYGGHNMANVNFGTLRREVATDAGYREKINFLTYSDRGDVYIHYARPEGCYREGEEYKDGSSITLMSGGMPSTEISALTLRGQRQDELAAQARDTVVEAGFYIPIFDIEGELVYSKSDFDADIASVEDGTYVSNEESMRAQREKAQEAAANREQQRLEQEAAAKGMTVDELQAWKKAQPIHRPNM